MKRYVCNWCGVKQKIKDEQIQRKPMNDRMVLYDVAKCVKCKKEHIMWSVNKLRSDISAQG